jgi:hypothetical protein
MHLWNIIGNSWLKDSDRPRNNFAEDIIALTYGGLTALMVMAFFVLMFFLGYSNIILISAVNIIFFSIGIFLAIRRYSGNGKANTVEYFEGLKLGLYTGCIASLLLSVFIGILLSAAPQIIEKMNQDYFWGHELIPIQIAVMVALVSIPAAFIAALICMQYFKKD